MLVTAMEHTVQVRVTAKGRTYHGPECAGGLDHGRDNSVKFGRQLHRIEWVSLATAQARQLKPCRHCGGGG